MKFTVLNTTGKDTTLEASDAVFARESNPDLIAQAVRVYLANQRQGTAKVKTRSEINRTKKKWFRQKGTGNARHGARSANIFVGGGVVHGPTGRQNYSLKMPAKMKQAALCSVLSTQRENIIVTTVLGDIQPKTKDAAAYLAKLAPNKKRILVVTQEKMPNIWRSMNNLSHVIVTTVQGLNIFNASAADQIIFTKEAVKALEARLDNQKVKSETKAESKPESKPEEKKPTAKAEAKPVKAPAKKPTAKKTVKKTKKE